VGVDDRRRAQPIARAIRYVFDLDGTISDPAVGIGRSINHALRCFGYPPISAGDVSKFIGPPLDHTFRRIVGSIPEERILGLVAKYRERYADIGYSENLIYPSIVEVLRCLDEAGIGLGLCTSKRSDFAERILARFGIRERFCVISGGDIGISKEKQLAHLLDERLIDKSSIMIGDRAVDIAAAKANGLRSAGVLWGHGSLEELQAASPDFLLASPHALLEHAHRPESRFARVNAR